MIDLDHLKNINDLHGHVIGDEVITSMSRAIMEQIRQDDYHCRYDGEEFALILPCTALATARKMIPRLKDTITSTLLKPENDLVVSITASIGVAACNNRHKPFQQTGRID